MSSYVDAINEAIFSKEHSKKWPIKLYRCKTCTNFFYEEGFVSAVLDSPGIPDDRKVKRKCPSSTPGTVHDICLENTFNDRKSAEAAIEQTALEREKARRNWCRDVAVVYLVVCVFTSIQWYFFDQ